MQKAILVVAVAVACVLASGVTPAFADGEDPEMLIHVGNDFRRKGDNKRAEGYLRRAYQLARTPRSAAQLGLVELALGNNREAEHYLTEALDADDSWIREHRDILSQSRDHARAALLGVEILGAPRDASVQLPGAAVQKLPPDGKLWLNPGEEGFEVQAPGYKSVHVTVTGNAGERRRMTVNLSPIERPPELASKPAAESHAAPRLDAVATIGRVSADGGAAGGASPPQDTRRSGGARSLRRAGIAAGAVGVVAGVAGVLILEKGNSKVDTTNDAPRSGAAYDPNNGNFKTLQQAGAGLLIAGAALAITGGVMFAWGVHAEKAQSAVSVSLGPGAGLLQWERHY